MTLWIEDLQADTSDIQAGIEAAERIFDLADIEPADAWDAYMMFYHTNVKTIGSRTWDDAEQAALECLCAAGLIPDEAILVVD